MSNSSDIFSSVRKLGLPLPQTIEQTGIYQLHWLHSGVIKTSGQLPHIPDKGTIVAGRLEKDSDIDEACFAGRICLTRALLVLHQALGDLSNVDRLLGLTIYINSSPEFTRHAEVANPASELAISLMGDRGNHTRSLIGVSSLPRNSLIELELTAAVS